MLRHRFPTLTSALARISLLPLILVPVTEMSAQDADFMGIVKSKIFLQTGPNDLGPDNSPGNKPFVLDCFADASAPNSLISVALDRPSGVDVPLVKQDDDTEFFFDQFFDSLAALDTAFANGSYVIKLVGLNDGSRSVTLDLSGDHYPTQTKFTNFADAQIFDHTTENTLTWGAIPGADTETWVFLEIENESGNILFETPFAGEAGSLTNLSTSVIIPASTLSEGSSYTVRLSMFERVDQDTAYGTALAGYETAIRMPIQTLGPDLEAPTLTQSIPFGEEDEIQLNSVVTLIFNEAMDQTIAPDETINWTGVPNPENFNYRWSGDGQTLFCHHTTGLPASTVIQWIINPTGSSAKLRDLAKNPLVDNAYQGSFTTKATSNLGTADVSRVELFKARQFVQTSDGPLVQSDYFAGAFIPLSGISTTSSADLDIPGIGLISNFADFEDDHRAFDVESSFTTQAELDTTYPAGTYSITLHSFNDGDTTVSLNLTDDAYPNAPVLHNFAATQAWDSTQPLVLTWDAMSGGTEADLIALFIEGINHVFFESPFFGEPGALDGTATTITIPANTLPPGRTLNAELAFFKGIDNDTTQYPGVRLISGLGSITIFTVTTTGGPFEPLVRISHDGTRASVKVTGERGQVYNLSASNNLQTWQQISTLWLSDTPSGFTASDSFEDHQSTGVATRFYRLEPAAGQ